MDIKRTMELIKQNTNPDISPEMKNGRVKKGVGKRGKNKSKYHFCVYDSEEDTVRYYFTMGEISKTYGMSRSTCFNILQGKRSCKYPNLRIERDIKSVAQIDLDLSEEEMRKYFPEKF